MSLVGKYESNHTAQELGACYADHAMECLDYLLELLEADLELQAITRDEGRNVKKRSRRQSAEASARRLLQKLEEATNRPDSGLSLPSMEEEASTSTSKWWVATVVGRDGGEEEESSGYSHTTK